MLLASVDFSLPLKNPVLIFALLLFIILFAPLLLNRLRIPHLIGLIIAGAVIGPSGFNFMLRDSSIVLFGTVGLLYIMFLAGLEIDLAEFKKNSGKSLVFGMYTFLIPMGLGTLVGIYLLHYSWPRSVLLASMFASHTLVSYPLVSQLGVAKNKAVNITVGGTLITDTLALLVLAVIVGMSVGDTSPQFWWRLGLSVVGMGLVILLLFPVVGRWFFKRFDDRISQYIFVLGMVFLGAFLAEAAGIEAIIGAFLAGLALNRLIPHTSPLMNRIEFVGNALFIPFFLIGVGMLIDFRAFVKDWNTIKVAALMTATATVAKFLAAWLTQKTFRFSADERRVIFGLSNAQAAATLAAVLVGYNVILNKEELRIAEILGTDVAPIRLLGEEILNGSILMILVTCTIATFAAQKGANNIAFAEDTAVNEPEGDGEEERILIPLSSEEGAVELVNLSLAIKSKSNKKGLYALHVVNKDRVASGGGEKQGRKLLEVAVKTASAADVHMQDLLRYDLNLVNGITSVVREHSISDIILGLTRQKTLSSSFLGNLTDGILTRVNTTTIIYRHNQPLSTIKRHVVVVPPRAERETGFPFWVSKLWNIARNTGARIVFYGSESTLAILKQVQERHPAELGFEQFDDWNDFLVLSRELHNDHNLVVVMSRKDHPSFHPVMQRIPNYLNKYFEKFNFILIYPMQIGVGPSGGLNLRDPAFLEPLELLEEVGNTLSKLFRKK